MTTQSRYSATDRDLPDVFFRAVPAARHHAPTPREISVAMHYQVPEWKTEKETRLRERKERANARLEANEERQSFVRGMKQAQMNVWLEALDAQRPVLSAWESEFVSSLLKKFRRYFPRVKWVTKKQFDCLKVIAVKHLKIPNSETL